MPTIRQANTASFLITGVSSASCSFSSAGQVPSRYVAGVSCENANATGASDNRNGPGTAYAANVNANITNLYSIENASSLTATVTVSFSGNAVGRITIFELTAAGGAPVFDAGGANGSNSGGYSLSLTNAAGSTVIAVGEVYPNTGIAADTATSGNFTLGSFDSSSAFDYHGYEYAASVPANKRLDIFAGVSVGPYWSQLGAGAYKDPASSVTGTGALAAAAAQISGAGYAVVSVMRPDATSAAGNWLTDSGGSNLHTALDEESADDNDYIISAAAPTNDVAKISLGNLAGVSPTTLTVRYRYRRSGSNPDQIDLRVRLLEGTTERASWLHTNIGTSIVQAAQTLTTSEFAAITDLDNLYLEFTANP